MNNQTPDAPEDEDASVNPPQQQPAPGPGETREALRLIEALLFASTAPINERSLAARIPDGLSIKILLKTLQDDYAERGVNLLRIGGAWAFRTATDIGYKLNIETEVSRKMGRAAIEVMAIIAYHQPLTRAEIEEIRGVSLSKGTLDLLFEKGWIRPRGRRETPGHPMTWGTSDDFLDHFGLSRISDLPGMDDLKAAGLLESGPALNVYRSSSQPDPDTKTDASQGDMLTAMSDNPAASQAAPPSPFAPPNGEDSLPEVETDTELAEPLDPNDGA